MFKSLAIRKALSLTTLISIIFLFSQCSGDKEISKIKVDPGFATYINAFTSGVISNQSNIKIVLSSPVTNAEIGSPVKEKLFSFEPKIEGEAYWLDQQTIEFRPNEKLPSGTSYKGHFELKKIMEVPEKFENLEFGFIIIKQSLFLSYTGIKTTDLKTYKRQDLFGTVRSSDLASMEDIKSCVFAQQNGKSLKIDWEVGENDKQYKYIIRDVERTNKESEVVIIWDGDAIGADVEDEMEIKIPPLNEFSVLKINTVQTPGLYFSIQFSDPVDPKQELNGLISLESGKNLRYVIDGNEVKAYPLQKLSANETPIINKNIINTKGETLKEEFRKLVKFNMEKPAVKLLGDGVIMPNSNDLSFPFAAINLRAVNLRIIRIFEHNVNQFFQNNHFNGSSRLTRVGRIVYDDVIDLVSAEALDYGVWNNFSVNLNNIISPEPGAIYRVMISFEQYQSLYPCADTSQVVAPLKRREINFDDNEGYFDDELWYEGWYDYDEKDNPCKPSYYQYYGRSISANIFSSNFGIIAKEGADNNYNVVVTDLRNTEALSGVSVEAYNFQNQKIGEGETNGDGVSQFNTDGKPYLIVAKQGNQRGYLRVDKGSALSVSLYEVGGAKIKKGIKGFIYGERGVWRPGDSLFLSFMLEDKLNQLPESHPIIMELYDPMGKLYDKKVNHSGIEGLYSFKFKTESKSPTGRWLAKAIVGNSTFSKSLKIETIKPNRIHISYDFGSVIKHNEGISSELKAKWLYGAPGANLKARIEMNVETVKTSFDKYEGYSFDDQTKELNYYDPIIIDRKTNSEGIAQIKMPWTKPSEAPGMLKLKFNTKVFEQGGDFSQDFLSQLYSPFESYVGVKMSRGSNWMTALDTDEKNTIALAAVNEDGKPIDKNVKIEVYKISWNYWWEGNGNDLTQYINRGSANLIKTDHFNISNGKSMYDLSFDNPGWGRFLIRVIDKASGHSATKMFYGSYSNWYNDNSSGENDAASSLNIETDKEKYNVGDDIEISMPSGGIGNFYITIEKGDKILDQMWVKAEAKSTTVKFKAEAEMAPNIYINAILIQPHGQNENSLPIRMYGIIPIEINDPETRITPVINSPNVLRPESSFKVKVSEKDGKAMAYTLAVVDEGLLSLTRFKTPEAWPVFYSKEALTVKTWDMYKYVMSAVSGKMSPLLAIGGDEGLSYKEDAEANRFKPVVTYLGPFFLDKGDENTHEVKIPNYIGAVRVMVVAGYEGAYGSTEKEIQVKQPLMVLSSLPRVLGPSEEVKIPINIITLDDKIKKVNVKLTTNELLEIDGSATKQVTFSEKGEKTIYFDYKVARKLGLAKFKVEVSSGKEKAFEELELIVRPPNPEISQIKQKSINASDFWIQEYQSFGINGTNSAVVQVSKVPDLNLEKHLNYLIRYPHGCIEQTTSSVFPQLFLNHFIELDDIQKQEVDKNIIAGLNRLKTFQLSEGGFSYWPGQSYLSEWGSNYAGHFILEAKNKGYEIPEGLVKQWLKSQKKLAKNWDRSRYGHYGRYGGDLNQAYRLYTLALGKKPELGAMNRLRKDPNLSNAAAWRLAAAYALAGRDDVAKELANRSFEVKQYRDMSYSFGSDVRDLSMILETMYYLEDKDNGANLIKDIASRLNDGWHSTQTRAYALLSMAKYFGNAGSSNFSAQLEINGKIYRVDSDNPVWQIELEEDQLKSGAIKLTNNSSHLIFGSLIQKGIPVELNEAPEEKALNMSIEYRSLNDEKIDPKNLKQGTDFKAIVTVKHPGIRSDYKEIALTQIFPSGWQIVNTRVGEETQSNSDITYQDIRDDRVYTYFDLNRSQSKQFEILLNATYTGKFYMPSVICAPMYDESVISIKSGQWVKVVE